MRSSNRPYLASVDHIRAFAVLLVVFYHGAQLFGAHTAHAHAPDRANYSVIAFDSKIDWLYGNNPIATMIFEGHSGVALFMVLSGFIFTVGTLGREMSYPRFMANRLLRIYPLLLLLTLMGIAANPGSFTLHGFVQLVVGLGSAPGSIWLGPISAMFWAVAVEVQFYLLFPLLNRILGKFGMTTFLRLFGAVIVVRGVVFLVANVTDIHTMLYFTLAGRIDQFLLGMIAAWLFVRSQQRFRGWWKVAVAAGLAVAMLWVFNQTHGYVANSPWRLAWVDLEGAVWGLVILTYVATCRSANRLSRATAKIGEFSYSIYLMHFMIIAIMIQQDWLIHLPGFHPVLDALVTTVLILTPILAVVGYLTYHGVERPFLKLRVKYLHPEPAEAPTVVLEVVRV